MCKVAGCERLARARELCAPHYKRWRRHGDPSGGGTARQRDAVCSIADCDRKHYGRGWCAFHYKRWKATGNPLHEHSYPPLAERFWAKVDVRGANDCWPWTGSRDTAGYGRIARSRSDETGGRQELAHRVSLELAGVEITPGQYVLHSCDNPPCVNPRHLRPGNQLDNMQDAIERGRHPRVNVRLARERGEYVAPPPKPVVCGTVPGYKAHLRDGETPCAPCRAANAARARTGRARRSKGPSGV